MTAVDEATYIVATTKPWNIEAFYQYTKELPGLWVLITEPGHLDSLRLEQLKPEYIFFPHWSWKVPTDIHARYDCVCFHMTDVPYGRGGSPLQNLIQRGHSNTQLTALKMVEELDAGPVYGKWPLSLSGSAQDIFERMSKLIYDAISDIVENNLIPHPQQGEVVNFDRRRPEQSRFPEKVSLSELYDHIRMLDAETYPRAFIDWGQLMLEFQNATFDEPGGEIFATVRIRLRKEEVSRDV